ncbi:ankyrin repeat domain-containing protein [Nakamurella endophytica]|uniref:Ankyrin repeat protein n=1 Tax=Nakamurella endophytica TaxID=1748367 RepID=A0A917WIY3_9ACTN|nr:ankyrin repeat domain-containing protein [Nakamurella endophytica]GGM07642.1 putative ankyrin repeat protein [Nakamurella endophytica]
MTGGPDPREPFTEEELAKVGQIFDLARGGVTDELAALLEAGVPVNLTNGRGDTLLLLAAYHRRPDTVRMLLARGADTDRVNDQGQTALGAAVFRNDPDLVRSLLDAGADPEAGGRTPAEIAAFFGLDDMAALLVEHRRG